jgi:multidrug efflux pump
MNITNYSLKNNRVTIVLLSILTLIGVYSLFSLPRAEDPGFVIRVANVLTYMPGSLPERMEKLVSDKLEKKILEIPEVNYASSVSKNGMSRIRIVVDDKYTEMRPIWDKLRRKVHDAKKDLPQNIYGPFVYDEFGEVFGTIISMTADSGFTLNELNEYAKDLKDDLLKINDVAKVDIYGHQPERIFIKFDDFSLTQLGMNVYQVIDALEQQNVIISGGNVLVGREMVSLVPTGNYNSIKDLEETLINISGQSEIIVLKDIATISRGTIDPPQKLVHTNSKRGIVVALSLSEGGNIVSMGKEVDLALKKFKQFLPIGVETNYSYFQPEIVDTKVNEFVSNLGQSIAIVFVVMLIFLGFKVGFLISSLIPIAMLISMAFMKFFNIGLDQMSLASLIIALGMLVDNGIVMVEAILVELKNGKKIFEASLSSANELKIPLLTSSLTTCAAFLPIFLAESATGEYTAPLFKVVSITLLVSWVLSLTFTPLLALYFFKDSQKLEDKDDKVVEEERAYVGVYQGLLQRVLEYRGVFLLVIVTFFIASLFGFKLIPKVFFPTNDRPVATLKMNLPVGTHIHKTEEVVSKIENYMDQNFLGKEVVSKVFYIGHSGPKYLLSENPTLSRAEFSFALINLSSFDKLEVVKEGVESFARETFPDLDIDIRPLNMGPPVLAPISLRISSRHFQHAQKVSEELKEMMKSMRGVKNVKDDWGRPGKNLSVEIDQLRAKRAKLSSRDISHSLLLSLDGHQASVYREGDQLIPITLGSKRGYKDDWSTVEDLNITSTKTGQSIPLKQVADLKISWGPSKVHRRNGERTITVTAQAEKGYSSIKLTERILKWLKNRENISKLPFNFSPGGDFEKSKEANKSIAKKLPIAMFIIFFLLILQFNSFRKTFIVLVTIPLSLMGVFLGLYLGNSVIGFMTLLGIISLAGIVVNNAIVLIDRIDIERDLSDLSLNEVIKKASSTRLRPILLTTLTTVGGLLPLLFFGGPLWRPMALSIIFGLFFATVLTLGVVPVLYSLFFTKTIARSS